MGMGAHDQAVGMTEGDRKPLAAEISGALVVAFSTNTCVSLLICQGK